MLSPQDFQFDLPADRRPLAAALAPLAERWAPRMPDAALAASSERKHPTLRGVHAIVVHATAGGSSAGALSVIRPAGASFHWLVPAENEAEHGRLVWACVPERRAAWHVRNECAHPQVCGGARRINHYSLGIEIVNRMRPGDPYSDWQIAATAAIIRYAWAKYPDLAHVVSHARLDPKRRTDPGAHFPWAELKRRVFE